MAKPTLLAAGKYKPLVGTVDPLGINLVAVADPVVEKFVPSNVRALPLATVVVPDAYKMPLAVYEVRPVPPLPTGKVPVTPLVKSICAHAGLLLVPLLDK